MKESLNKQWHEGHRLGSGASLDDRLQWHVEHAKACGCRPIPTRVLEEIGRRGIVVEPRTVKER
jgi:hypothetical protein